MRNIAIVFFACTQVMLAEPPEPQPYTTTPPPVGLPIDSGVWMLLIIAIIFSFYKLKPLLKHKKTPM